MALLARALITIVDMTDVIIQSAPPTAPKAGDRWINTGTSPYVLYKYGSNATWAPETDYDILNAFSMHDIVLEDMTADSRLTPYEKSQLSKIIMPILAEANALKTQASALGSTTVTQLSNAITALESLYNTHVTKSPNGTSDVPPTFDADLKTAINNIATAVSATTVDIEKINRPVVIDLSKDSHLIEATTAAAIVTNETIYISAYKGTTPIKVSVTNVAGAVKGLSAVVDQKTNNSTRVSVAISTTTEMTTKAGSLVFTISADGKTYTKSLTYALALTGMTGAGGYMLTLTNESHVFAGSVATAVAGEVTTEVIAYKGATRIPATFGAITSPKGMQITKVNGDGKTNASLTISVDEGLTPLRGTVIIPITIDGKEMAKTFSYSVALKGEGGKDGKDAIYTMVSTPDGDVFQSVAGSSPTPLKVICDLYVGSTALAKPDVSYQWFIQEGSGEEGAGPGWKKIISTATHGTSGYTTNTLVVPASAVPSTESFKCKVTYGSSNYYGVATLRDTTDPYQIVVECLQGDSFFNSSGDDKTLTARIYQNGVEVDSNGTVFSYSWQKFIGGNQDTSVSLNTKNIKVKASDVLKEATYICNVSKKA